MSILVNDMALKFHKFKITSKNDEFTTIQVRGGSNMHIGSFTIPNDFGLDEFYFGYKMATDPSFEDRVKYQGDILNP